MAFIGNTPTTQAFTPAIDYFSGNGSTTAFTLSRPVASVAQVQVVIDNVAQNPSSAYTVSSNTITFTSAPLSGTNNIYVYYTSPITQLIAPGQGTVGTTALVDASVTTAKLASTTGSGAVVLATSPTITTPVISSLSSASATALTLQSAGTTAITVDTSQNVGVGTTPVVMSNNPGLQVSTQTIIQNVVSNQSLIAANAYYSGSWKAARTQAGYAAVRLNALAAGYISFHQSSSSYTAGDALPNMDGSDIKMVIDNSGYVGIGTSSPSSYGALAVRKGVSGTWAGIAGNCSFETSDAIYNSFYITHNGTAIYLGTDTSTRLQMYCSATAAGGVYLSNGATSWTSASDERVKENLVPIKNGLTKVASLRAVTGNYINDADKTVRPFLIAQDVHAVLPEAVNTKDENEWGLAYTDVIPLLVASIKELKAINDTQAETINALTARIEALENR